MKPLLKPAAVLLLASLCACNRDTPAPGASAGNAPAPGIAHADDTHTDARLGFSIALPAGMALRHDFRRSYLGDGSWKAFAPPGSRGTPVLALVLQGSNDITAAELRIGVSDDADALAHCTDMPANGSPAPAATEPHSGTPFAHFRAGDAAMSHYLDVESYRAVRRQRCYAIDLLVTGTNPQVYDPPATPPFGRDAAQRKLREALAGFRFLD
ncbi:hypothetical protein ASG87_17215 [Frateuria sp. Soil773]|uniref:hypothetical protein n=1 Tax=Frateuria sp. Soil773 TaxID=1736407 RepID=UPI0006F7B2C5|nr:hypothetical protein [Frateuria sp. Soil773]KRE95015.1 hypothetical protein ASG87_17215 [Frateuria sp. Soil773]